MSRLLYGLLLQLCVLFVVAQAAATDKPPEKLDCDKLACKAVLPGATRFESAPQQEQKPYLAGYNASGELCGWVVLSTDVINVKGYSGKPLVTLVGLTPAGKIAGARVVYHSEPILLVGIPERKMHEFVNRYAGKSATEKIVVGKSADPKAVKVDVISGATVTVLAANRTITETARLLGAGVGVIKGRSGVAGHFVDSSEVWSWSRMSEEKVFGRLTVEAEEMGLAAAEQPFIDLHFTLADVPQVGRSLLGDREYEWMMSELAPGEHLLVVLGRGSSSFKGSGFVRGGLFDRVRVEQGLRSLMFRDLDYHNLAEARSEGAPEFDEGAVFIARDGQLDPGSSFDLVFLGSRYDQRGGFSRDFHAFRASHRMPKSVYVLDGPDPEQAVWRAAWYNRRGHVLIGGAYLLLVAGIFAARRWTTASMRALNWLHLAVLLLSFGGLGLWLRAQPSVTQLFTLVDATTGEWQWGLFLSEPLLFVSWIFIAGVVLIWGRGVFCGWVCPYGAFNELLFRLGRKLRLPRLELPDRAHKWLRHLRYLVLAVVVGSFVYSAELGEKLAEIEPFKSTFFVAPWSREVLLFGWWIALAALALVWYRPFCRYLCPLGAALALPGSLRGFGPYRRKFCNSCKICTRGCESRAIRDDGSIDPRECLSCMECEANYRDKKVCPPLIGIERLVRKPEAELTQQQRDKLQDLRDSARTTNSRELRKSRAQRTGRLSGMLLLVLGWAAAEPASAATLRVGSEASVQSTIEQAKSGDVVEVPAGTWSGPVVIDKAIVLRGIGGVITGNGQGSVVRVDAPGVVLEALKIQSSGTDLGAPDACVYLTRAASGALVRQNELSQCAFGIWVHETDNVELSENRIRGTTAGHRSNRGNGIHLFNASRLVVRRNHVSGGRDGIYVSATEDSLIEQNRMDRARYGVHYMFSYRNVLRENVAQNNFSGFALMESREIQALQNRAIDNQETGILFRDAQLCHIAGNELVRNGVGFFFYSSTENRIERNLIRENRVGAKIWAGSLRNQVSNNAFVGNADQIMYVSPQDLVWGEKEPGNFWSDYLGWDQNGDGAGDRPYRVDSFSTHLRYKYPASGLLLRSPILELLSHLSDSLPLLKVSTVVDQHPRMQPRRMLP